MVGAFILMKEEAVFDIENKNFRNDLEILIKRLENKSPFAFSKYADGEFHVLNNQPVNNGEFWFIPESHQKNRIEMVKSFRYQHDDYYVGISCPCCIGGTLIHNWMKNQSKQKDDHLTWANLFVNGNYEHYTDNMIPEFKNFKTILISNSDSNLDKLPFDIKEHFKIGKNAWVENYDLTEEIKDYISTNELKNHLFLFCAGPYGNILTHQLHEHSQENFYIDIGSTLNPLLLGEMGKNRGYLRKESSIDKVCMWGN